MELASGSNIGGRYTVERRLGQGGMAVVYCVRHDILGSLHALKVLRIPSRTVRERLLQEGRIQSRLRHPNIAAVTDVVDVGGAPGLVMELVVGPTLDAFLAAHRPTLAQADALVRGILAGVVAAHAVGLIHRDLKPSNVLLSVTSDGMVPKITDFGIAKLVAPEGGGPTPTASGVAMGSPPYMAPEQIRDASRVDERSDVFALGAMLYEVVTGHRAFVGADTFEVYDGIVRGRYTDPRRWAPDLPDRMERAIVGALHVDPGDRVQSVAALLATWVGPGGEAPADGAWDPELLATVRLATATVEGGGSTADSGATWAAGAGSTWATGAGSTWATGTSSLPGPEATPPLRSRAPIAIGVALVAVVALLALLVVAVGPWGGRPPVHDPFTRTSAPTRSAVTAAQGHLARGWSGLLDADLEAAERELRAALAADPGLVDAHALLIATLTTAGRYEATLDAREAARAAPRGERDVALLDLLAPGDFEAVRPAYEARFAADPSDLLPLLLLALDDHAPVDVRLDATERLLAGPGAAPLAAYVRASLAAATGRDEVARAALADGLARFPDAPRLLLLSGELANDAGAFEEARGALVRALQVAPGLLAARRTLAATATMLGDRALAEEQAAVLSSETAPVDERLAFLGGQSEVLLGLGRVEEARKSAEEGAALARRHHRYGALFDATKDAFRIDYWTSRYDRLDEDLRVAREATAAPELSAAYREKLLPLILLFDGIATVQRGDRARAAELLERLPEGSPERPQLARLLAVADRDVEAIDRSYPDPTCVEAWFRGLRLLQAGAPERGLEALRSLVGGTPRCSALGADRWALGHARALLARGALDAGQPTEAAVHLRALRTLWPEADPTLAVLRDLPSR